MTANPKDGEPTEAMVEAGTCEALDWLPRYAEMPNADVPGLCCAIYRAMVAASPPDQGRVEQWQPMSRVPKHGRRIYALERGGQASIIYANPELDRRNFLAWWPLPEHGLDAALTNKDTAALEDAYARREIAEACKPTGEDNGRY